ncbi:MAG: DMT family transporter [Burkholderiales bacterium]|nr:DMT family transporter [Burkholderiales bacterium]
MHVLAPRQLALLVLVTLIWGVNWPIMKAGVTGLPPLMFRTLSMWIGLPVLALAMLATRTSFTVPRGRRGEVLRLAVTNMVVWHVLIIMAIPMLSSGRAAILGYTMPIFAALFGALWFGQKLLPRGWLGIGAAGLGVGLLLWHEVTHFSGRPTGVFMMVTAAAFWALGTHQLRRTTLPVSTLTITFWMTAVTTLSMSVLSVVFEHDQWRMPGTIAWASIAYNGVMIFGLAQPAWFFLARGLPPLASSLSVMFIPVLGVFTGALMLGEVLHWQDWAAVVLIVVAIASVLLPARPKA